MPQNKYLKVWIGGRQVDLETLSAPLSISYKLEDPGNFQTVTSAEQFSLVTPASVTNDRIANTFHNPGFEDLSPGQKYRSFQNALIEANGHEILVGKAILTEARHASVPLSYEWDLYGNNADWIIDLKEATLFDFLKHINFEFTKENIVASWAFDGTDENLPYVFAPVRYGDRLADYTVGASIEADKNMKPEYMKPALSKYWLIYWAFKSLGYKISSTFLDTEYFRRQVMPWTWGSFLFSEGTRLDTLDFLAKSLDWVSMVNTDFTGVWDVNISNETVNGAFDNNGSYAWNAGAKRGEWTYLPAFNYGTLEATFHFAISVEAEATANSDIELRVKWYKNGVHVPHGNDNGNGNLLLELDAPAIGNRSFYGILDDFISINVDPGDVISAEVYLHTFDSGLGHARIWAFVEALELEYFRIPLGGTIDFEGYPALKKYKFLDFLGGVCDEFNIKPTTDPVNKVVVLEPLHDYSLTDDQSVKSGGYLNGRFLDWTEKQDIKKTSALPLNSDSDRELLFKYKDDSSDGILKMVQDRYTAILGQGKYAFPDRFKAGKKEIENRFFSPTVHVELDQWKGLGSDPDAKPQIVCIIPENISNTSAIESQNTFQPKSCFYKGIVDHVGWIFDNEIQAEFPFMFAVNYQEGGEEDPILSYSDERIGPDGEEVVGKGLLRRFFLQRLAIMRNGQSYQTHFKLKNIDVANSLHREHIVCRGQKWELVEIKDFDPLSEETTACNLRKWSPITLADSDNVFPSEDSVLDSAPITNVFDLKYAPMRCFISDIPKPE